MTVFNVLVPPTFYTEIASLTFDEYLLGRFKIIRGPKIVSSFLPNILNFSTPTGGATYLKF